MKTAGRQALVRVAMIAGRLAAAAQSGGQQGR